MEKLQLRRLRLDRILFFLISFVSSELYSQNLVPNPSFENISNCPFTQSQLQYTINWSNPNTGTSDLFNLCNNDLGNVFGVPNNTLGSENASDGVGYSGMFTYSNQLSSTVNLREYIQSQLTSTLNSCFIYEVSFYVSLSDSSHYAINSIGAFLGDSAIHRDDYYCFSYYDPQVKNPKSRMLDSKNGWMKIEGKFVASGDEKYITIGNFDLDDELDTIGTNNNYSLNRSYTYYYIDNVSLTQFADASMSANAGPDAGIAVGDSIFIGQEISNLNCTWTELGGGTIASNTSGLYVKPTVTTTYIVEQNLCGTITTDTVQIFVHGVGLSSLEGGSRRVTVYPNPSSGSFSIETDEPLLHVDLFDELGRQLELNWIDLQNFTYSSDLATGVYTVLIETLNGRIINQKISVQDH